MAIALPVFNWSMRLAQFTQKPQLGRHLSSIGPQSLAEWTAWLGGDFEPPYGGKSKPLHTIWRRPKPAGAARDDRPPAFRPATPSIKGVEHFNAGVKFRPAQNPPNYGRDSGCSVRSSPFPAESASLGDRSFAPAGRRGFLSCQMHGLPGDSAHRRVGENGGFGGRLEARCSSPKARPRP